MLRIVLQNDTSRPFDTESSGNFRDAIIGETQPGASSPFEQERRDGIRLQKAKDLIACQRTPASKAPTI